MTRLPEHVIGDARTSTFAWDLLEQLVDIENRMAGHDGEMEGAAVVRSAFEDVGLSDVAIDEFDLPGWWRGSSAITVPDRDRRFEAEHEVLALPGTPPGDVTGEVVDLGYGLPEDFDAADVEGRIAMVRSDSPDDADHWYHRMEKYAFALEAGADAFVFRNHIDGCLPPTGEVGYGNRPGPIPAVGVSAELGARLARYADADATARVTVDCETGPATAPNIEGSLGPDTDEAVLVTAHVDAHDTAEGAVDNGVGTVMVCEIARLLSRVVDDLDTRVRFVVVGAEEVGLYGSSHLAATTDRDDVKCVLNIDGSGKSRTPKVRRTNTFEELVDPFETVAADLDIRFPIDESVAPHGDCWPWTERGIPAATVGSTSPASGRGWGHTQADTLDKIDVRDLRDLAIAYTSAVLELADDSRAFPEKDPSEIRDALHDGYVRELKAAGRWRFD
ncbi:M28 family peptidase [Halorubrum sp. JWXQ-INN 858]|uniref:M28 family peptidase n=1 Tax=Halorubrum sp. JWXQ-INN 858 TaxID=2690782 RepID=UPI0013567401|nr:M28 family peptidase [Halorubrum sp. JWXQ-INN 858]MWV65953.1 M28 family peptidase [Halorubrum sp. JWXQ-INN 858]